MRIFAGARIPVVAHLLLHCRVNHKLIVAHYWLTAGPGGCYPHANLQGPVDFVENAARFLRLSRKEFVSINFIPNDPLAVDHVPLRSVTPRPNRKAGQARLVIPKGPAEKQYEPGTPEFVFWQCREAALLAISVWEGFHGPLKKWSSSAANPNSLNLAPDAGDDLNAFYDRSKLAFFHHTFNNITTYSGASTDVVAHECGHAFLDTLRPELFGSAVTEHGAIHEAFGDCMAVLVALSDKVTRQALLAQSPDLGTANFVEATAEDLSAAVKRELGANHPAAEPRHALNNFVYQLPTTLPTTGGPNVLTSEIHSFGRIFSGCFYDTIRNIFTAGPRQDEASLLAASQTAAKLLTAGIQQAATASRFFQSVGRAMSLADQAQNNGANRTAIAQAFSRHGILLGSMSALMPKASLAGPAPRLGARAASATLAPQTLQDIRRRIDAASGARVTTAALSQGDERFVEAVHHREVRLDGLAPELRGVVAIAPEGIVVGASGKMAAVFNNLPDASTTTDEVRKFVETLLANDRIEIEKPRRTAASAATRPKARLANPPTHRIQTQGRKKVLTRIRFQCPHCGGVL